MKAKSVDGYISGLPKKQATALRSLRRTIKAAAPKAEEKLSWGMPFYYHNGMLIAFAAFKNHLSLVTMGSKTQRKYAKELAQYEKTRGTIHFTPEKPIPASLVKKIVKLRLAENK